MDLLDSFVDVRCEYSNKNRENGGFVGKNFEKNCGAAYKNAENANFVGHFSC